MSEDKPYNPQKSRIALIKILSSYLYPRREWKKKQTIHTASIGENEAFQTDTFDVSKAIEEKTNNGE